MTGRKNKLWWKEDNCKIKQRKEEGGCNSRIKRDLSWEEGGGIKGGLQDIKKIYIYIVEYHKLGYYLNLSESKKKGSYEFSY